MKPIYLDYAATTPVDEKVLEKMKPYFSSAFGNPSSIYQLGLDAKNAIKRSRELTASLINAKPSEIYFTGSGTESDNLAILGTARANIDKGDHVIISKIEHPAVLESAKQLEKEGFEVSYLNVDQYGLVDIQDIIDSIKDETILISIMFANNEIGTIEPVKEIGKAIEKINQERIKRNLNRIYFHTDACQAASFFKLDVDDLKVDLLTINGSKIYGPKGSGFLYVRTGTKIEPIIFGGKQENGLRSGTENVANIVGLVKAFELAQESKDDYFKKLKELKKYFTEKLEFSIDKILINGSSEHSLPNIVSITILDVEGESMLLALDQKDIACSTGSACSMRSLRPSHVLKAIGLTDEAIHGSLRFSMGKFTTKEEIDYTIEELTEITDKLRKISPIKIELSEARVKETK